MRKHTKRNIALTSFILILTIGSGFVYAVNDGSSDGSQGMTGTNFDGQVDPAKPANVGYDGSVPETPSTFNSGSNPVPMGDASYATGRAPSTRYGIFYLVWHCLAGSDHYNVYTNLGPPLSYNWHGEPSLGYYCPLENREILRTHAIQLRDAGIDFVFVDLTNFDGTEEASGIGASQPFQALVEEWSKIRGAPKIVPWMPFRNGGVLPAFVDALYTQYPQISFYFKGKPLWLDLWDAIPHVSDPNLLAQYSQKYTIRKETIMSPNQNDWDFIKFCQHGFRESSGTIACAQSLGRGPDGSVESVGVVTAYQETLATAVATAIPKFDGRTFHQSMARMDDPDVGEPPLVMITGWNEWIAVRYCQINGMPTADCTNGSPLMPDGIRPVFVDQYDDNFNRDIEPGGGYGDKYYKMLIDEVYGRKRARSQLIGYIDTVTRNADGSGSVQGWACQSGYDTAIQVELYANGPAGVGELVAAGTADQSSEEAVGILCQDGSVGNHRFSLGVSATQMSRYASQTVYVRGISPIGRDNFLLSQSGTFDFTGKKTGSALLLESLAGNMTPIYRFRAAAGVKHFFTANFAEGIGAGMVSEGQSFSVVPAGTAGTRTIYRCNANGNFISTDPGCEHQVTEGPLGGVFATPGGGLIPIYRMYNEGLSDHLETANLAEGLTNGYKNEGLLGYASP